MFRSLNLKNVEIDGIDKSKLLVELFNNAKKSEWTEATIGNKMCPDKFVHEMMGDYYPSRIQEKLSQLHLTEEDAKSRLESDKYVDYIGLVAIKIDFSTNTLDVTEYNKTHKSGNNVQSAEKLIGLLKPEVTQNRTFTKKQYFQGKGSSVK